ncbi:MAG: Phage polymerase-related protein [Gemmatimonadetes bacterium]|nr:Phage polymerase-related protein [Gemmatimonadota bacterium]
MSAADFFPERITFPSLRAAAATCRGCPLWKLGTQTVFGEGARRPRLMIVGEQPGDQEDREGHPFVGPSGLLLDRALEAAGIERGDAYVTNAVKHFKWVPDSKGGKRRIHAKPSTKEVRACHPWLDAEIHVLQPKVILALGATAAQSLFGPATKVIAQRGRQLKTELAEMAFVTVHPSAVLRAPGALERKQAEKEFVADLKKVARYLRA